MMNLPLFSKIPYQDCVKIISTANRRMVLAGQILFKEYDRTRQVFLLVSGCAKVIHTNAEGKEAILRLTVPGDILGVFRDFASEDSQSTVEAIQPCTALAWDAILFESYLQRFPALSDNVAQILSQQLRDLERRFCELATEKVSSRLLKEIIRLVERVGLHTNGQVEIHLSCEELAQLTGTSLFTVSRLLTEWERQGFLTTGRRSVAVRDLQMLIDLSVRNGESGETEWKPATVGWGNSLPPRNALGSQ
jgi:CRP-like cAMP-binding protein